MKGLFFFSALLALIVVATSSSNATSQQQQQQQGSANSQACTKLWWDMYRTKFETPCPGGVDTCPDSCSKFIGTMDATCRNQTFDIGTDDAAESVDYETVGKAEIMLTGLMDGFETDGCYSYLIGEMLASAKTCKTAHGIADDTGFHVCQPESQKLRPKKPQTCDPQCQKIIDKMAELCKKGDSISSLGGDTTWEKEDSECLCLPSNQDAECCVERSCCVPVNMADFKKSVNMPVECNFPGTEGTASKSGKGTTSKSGLIHSPSLMQFIMLGSLGELLALI